MRTRSGVLSKEERDVLILVAQHPNDRHLTNSEIAQCLGVSVSKVKTLIHRACLKLGAHNRNEAVLLAARRREISFTDLLSLEEQAELLSPLGTDTLRRLAHQLRQKGEIEDLLAQERPTVRVERCVDGILTNREREVLILVGRGLTSTEIAASLYISLSAVRTFLYRAFTKLGARRRADAVRLALKQREILIGEIFPLSEALRDLSSLRPDAFEKIADLLEQRFGHPPSTGLQ